MVMFRKVNKVMAASSLKGKFKKNQKNQPEIISG
jgi:hypothetical protein